MQAEWLYGIDTAAHVGALNANGKTIAVLPSGFNEIYPKENHGLYDRILQNKGLVITEYSPEEKAKSEHFLERNRIVSGISIGVLVIEAAYRSGTSVTARYAKEEGKKVFVIPHEISDVHGVGTNKLIRQGAILVTSVKEIMQEYDFLNYDEKISTNNLCDRKVRKVLKNDEYKEIYDLIENEPISINEIIRRIDKPISYINKILFMLEIEDYIEKVENGYKLKMEE